MLVTAAVCVAFSSAAAVAVVCEPLLLWRYVDHCDLLAVAFGISYYTHSNGIHKREIKKITKNCKCNSSMKLKFDEGRGVNAFQ